MRVTQWREDAQPEWPQAAVTTGELPSDGRARDRRATQVFAGSDVQATGSRLPAGTERLSGIPRQSEGGPDSPAPDASTGPAVRDPWLEDAEPAGATPPDDDSAEHTHDPHEVTVQLDAVLLGDGFVRQVKEGTGPEAAADRPVFVDESGRRSRRYRRIWPAAYTPSSSSPRCCRATPTRPGCPYPVRRRTSRRRRSTPRPSRSSRHRARPPEPRPRAARRPPTRPRHPRPA